MIFLSELTIGAHLPANKNSFASLSIAHKHLSIKLIHLDEFAVCRLLLTPPYCDDDHRGLPGETTP